MRKFRVLNKRGVHSMSAGRSWYLNQYVFEGEVPDRLISAWLDDGAVVEELDEVLCAGVTAKGDPCKRKPLDGEQYCKAHLPEDEPDGA